LLPCQNPSIFRERDVDYHLESICGLGRNSFESVG
jgi:hypothetical protein